MITIVLVQAIAQALLEGDCFSANVATLVIAETSAIFEVVENCDRADFSIGDAFGDTSGSTAAGVRPPPPRLHACSLDLCNACCA